MTKRENFSFGPVLSGTKLCVFCDVKGCLSFVQSSGVLLPFIKWPNAIVLFSVQFVTLDISNIWSFIFTPLSDKTNARTRGVMWRIIMIYAFFILSGILGILNTFPKIRKALDQKPRFGRFQSFPLYSPYSSRSNRSLIISTLLILLNVLWVLCHWPYHLSSFSTNSLFFVCVTPSGSIFSTRLTFSLFHLHSCSRPLSLPTNTSECLPSS